MPAKRLYLLQDTELEILTTHSRQPKPPPNTKNSVYDIIAYAPSIVLRRTRTKNEPIGTKVYIMEIIEVDHIAIFATEKAFFPQESEKLEYNSFLRISRTAFPTQSAALKCLGNHSAVTSHRFQILPGR
ncbi:hypothetical protein BCON_0008g00220 [Botryotinia convoluta]|uniref:Uncharacterized protein n=1 Tax=Botryotinia convoluta TaxID=54673 RepID=A0A4Z1IS54_9HELO|nr:hypothetical protein BCON_0008g00220 [Botryotinia convoluta]